MSTWVRKSLSVGVLAAGALVFASGAAHAGQGAVRHTAQGEKVVGAEVRGPVESHALR
jgi:hypothetical protein